MELTGEVALLASGLGIATLAAVVTMITGIICIVKKPVTRVLDPETTGVIYIVIGMVLMAAVAIIARWLS